MGKPKKRERHAETLDELRARVLGKAAAKVAAVQTMAQTADDVVQRGVLELLDELLDDG